MPIDFACPDCHRHYRVKDELAGKGAKCGKCGRRMQIPAATSASSSSKAAPTAKPAGSSQPVKQAPQAVAAASKAPSASSWLDEELEGPQPAVMAAPKATAQSCPSCGASLSANAVLCVSCGYDFRTQVKHETRHAIDTGDKPSEASTKPRGKLAGAASLLRGTVFSFMGAMLGAVIWAGLVYLTEFEIGWFAWGLGGLAGLGMALGHDDDDGTFAGIIAAFMSLFGVVSAKILIVVIFLSAVVMGELEGFDPVKFQRDLTASAIAEEQLAKEGIDIDEVSDEQWEAALAAANAEVASMTEEELTKRMDEMEARAAESLEAQQAQEHAAEQAGQIAEADDVAPPAGGLVALGFLALFVALIFRPFDIIFILLAVGTAYKVGSGKMTD